MQRAPSSAPSSASSQTPSGKPPYRIPTMAEIAAVPWCGYRIVSTFSGCGGSCLGFRWAGFRTLWASEFIKAARDTYRANHPGVPIDPRDIRLVKGHEVREAAGLGPTEDIDVLEGSPPCASFSMSGKRERSWGQVRNYSDTQQRVDDLFWEFIRLVNELQPRVFVAENVAGLTKGVAVGVCKRILASMRETGYTVDARILDAQWLGVPQHRERIIFVGVRPDVGRRPAFPAPMTYRYSLRDALPELFDGDEPHVSARNGPHFRKQQLNPRHPLRTITTRATDYAIRHSQRASFSGAGALEVGRDITESPAPTILASGGRPGHFQVVKKGGWKRGAVRTFDLPAPTVQAYGIDGSGPHQVGIENYAIGVEAGRLAPGEKSEKYMNLMRAHPERPSPTVTVAGGELGAAGVIHPTERRKFSIAELRRICGFPDDFVLTGSYSQQWERLGRAVPPPMMYAVARVLRDKVLA